MEFFKLSILFCCLYVCISSGNGNLQTDDLKLELVQVLFRHGARTPLPPGINSCNIADTSPYEPYGFAELTNEGKQQKYEFGKFLRHRYNNHLSIRYNPKEIYAYSSDLPRTRTSLEMVLDGLYPQVDPTSWNNHLKWSRIPYIVTPKNFDTFLGAFHHPRFLKLLASQLKSEVIKSTLDRYKDFYEFLSDKGVVTNCSSPLMTIGLSYEVLIANEYMNLPLPEWYSTEIKERFKETAELVWDTIAGMKEMQKFGIGSVVKTFIDNLNLHGRNDNSKKMYLYAAHDVNIALFTRAHDIDDFRVPPFGSALILEKFRDSKNQTYLRLLAWDGKEKIDTLKLGNHEEFCPIEDYLRLSESVLLSESETNEMLDEIMDTTSSKQIKYLLFENLSAL